MAAEHLISVAELQARLGAPRLRVLDASCFPPTQGRNAANEFAAEQIAGAGFFDIDRIVDPQSTLPHTLAPEPVFTAAVRALGIDDGDEIIVYDSQGLYSAPRVWWNFRLAGATNVKVLDGGLPAWKAAGGPLASGLPEVRPGSFTARYDRALLRSFDDVLGLVQSGAAGTLVDARAAARFRGEVAEPRAGLRSGHITGGRNVPFAELVDETGRLKPADAIRTSFADAGVDLTGPIVVSCGSGVTAAVLALGLATIGRADVPIYDGSWSEWGARAESAPFIATGSP